MGGSDQWGNIIAGIELAGKLSTSSETDGPSSGSESPFGITTPLLTTPSGEKFGKSAGNAVWLDETLTSVFDFYQYFLKSPDAAMSSYLKLFTFLSRKKIDEIVEAHNVNPEHRVAQKLLAAEVTEMVHGGTHCCQVHPRHSCSCSLCISAAALARVQTLTSLLFPTSTATSSSTSADYSNLTTSSIISAFGASDPRLVYVSQNELVESTPVFKLAKSAGLAASNGAAKTLVTARGLYMNNVVVPDIQTTVSSAQLIDGRVVVLRAGKDKIAVLIAQ